MSVAPKAGDAADAGGLMRLRPHDGLGAPEYTGRATNGGHAIHRARHRGGHRHPCRRPRALTPAKLADFEVTESFATAAYVPIRPRLRRLRPYRPLRLRRVLCPRRLVRPHPLLRPHHPPRPLLGLRRLVRRLVRTPTLAHAARTPSRSRAPLPPAEREHPAESKRRPRRPPPQGARARGGAATRGGRGITVSFCFHLCGGFFFHCFYFICARFYLLFLSLSPLRLADALPAVSRPTFPCFETFCLFRGLFSVSCRLCACAPHSLMCDSFILLFFFNYMTTTY
ncbi:hypothetical protein C8J57DRAFT_1288039 [Mycena rebaudengoi]|nr:hypothetical protein C8J57DRAFT_1288039 [Mycena rebaudengoi]